MSSYDINRWFELLKSAPLEEIQAELAANDRLFLLNAVDAETFNQTCVFYAVNDDNELRGDSLLELLINEGANACYKDGLDQTALFYAACKGHRNQIELLCRNGANPGEVDTYGQSPIFYAAREGHIHILEQLVTQRQVNVNQVDNTGQSSLFYACRDGRLEAVKFLVEHGNINLHQEDKQKQTALTWAKKQNKKDIVEYLLSKGVTDPTVRRREEANKTRGKVEKQLKCQLMLVNERGEKRAATEEELKQFEENYPDVAKFWKNPGSVAELDKITPEQLEAMKPWEKPGKKLLNILWRSTHAWIFHEPVDPVKLDIEDYFEIVKNPMDLGTIKKKLNNNVYGNGNEFLSDIELVFANCRLYNKPGSDAYIMCESVQEVYNKQIAELELEQYRDASAAVPMEIEPAQEPVLNEPVQVQQDDAEPAPVSTQVDQQETVEQVAQPTELAPAVVDEPEAPQTEEVVPEAIHEEQPQAPVEAEQIQEAVEETGPVPEEAEPVEQEAGPVSAEIAPAEESPEAQIEKTVDEAAFQTPAEVPEVQGEGDGAVYQETDEV